jgi:hypothetical protein
MPSFSGWTFRVIRSGQEVPDFVPTSNESREHIPFSDDDVIEDGGKSPGTVTCDILVPVADRNTWKTSLNGAEATLVWFLGESFTAKMKVSNGRFLIDESGYIFSAEIIKL